MNFKIFLVLLASINLYTGVNSGLAYAEVNGNCVYNSKYDGDFKENYYCGALTTWNISKDDFYNQDNHRVALQRYQELYRLWMEKEVTDGKEDCLGIGWYFFCTTAIGYCDAETQVVTKKPCSSACDLFKFRCPDVKLFNHEKNSSRKQCSMKNIAVEIFHNPVHAPIVNRVL